MLESGTDPESYITENTLVYEEKKSALIGLMPPPRSFTRFYLSISGLWTAAVYLGFGLRQGWEAGEVRTQSSR